MISRKMALKAAASLALVLTATQGAVAQSPAASQEMVQEVTATGATVHVALGKSRVVRVDRPFDEIVLARPETADVRVLTNRSFYIYGKQAGATNILLLNRAKQPVAVVDLEVGFDLDGIRNMVSSMLPGEPIQAHGTPNGVILRGLVSDASVAQQAQAIAERFVPGAVTNGLSVKGPQQVVMEVRFLEAQRSVGRELGLNTFAADGDFAIATGAQSGTGFIGDGLASARTAFGALRYLDFSGDQLIDIQIDALEEKGVVRTLAEPNLAALSGDTATFLAGGEFPIPVGAENDRITIEFKEFGVALAFTPTVLADGKINLKVSSEVSQLDFNNAIRAERITIPALVVRRAATTIELKSGQSMAMAGLIQNTYSNNRSQVPWVGDVPVLGALFSSTRFARAETELVVIVTPRLITGTEGTRLRDPNDRSRAPTELELFMGGAMEMPALPPAEGGSRRERNQP